MEDDNDDEIEGEPEPPYWFCESCGHEDHKKPMPKDRGRFYDNAHEKGFPKCPKCKSETFVPMGY